MKKYIEKKLRILEVLRLSFPAILAQLTTIIMQYIDSAMVGNLSANASASIGLVASTTWLFNGVTFGLSNGFSVQVAHHIGAKEIQETKKVVKNGLIFAVEVSTLLCLVALFISNKLPVWLGGETSIQNDAANYFFVFALMLPFSQLNSLCTAFLQAFGDMRTPSILNGFMCFLDVVFNAIFIPKYGVLGASIGTTLACIIVSFLMFFACCFFNKSLSIINFKCNKLDINILRKALKIGLPIALQEIAMCGAMVISTAIIAPLGSVAIAANSFAITAESLCYMPGYGIGSAATAIIGRNYGSGDYKSAKNYGKICTVLGGVFMGVTGAIMAVICPYVFAILTPDQSVRNLACEVLRIGLVAEPLFGVSIVATGALCGVGDTLIPSVMNLGSIWCVRIVLALILVKPLGLHGMWLAMAVELCLRGVLLLWRQMTSKHYKIPVQ